VLHRRPVIQNNSCISYCNSMSPILYLFPYCLESDEYNIILIILYYIIILFFKKRSEQRSWYFKLYKIMRFSLFIKYQIIQKEILKIGTYFIWHIKICYTIYFVWSNNATFLNFTLETKNKFCTKIQTLTVMIK